MDGTGARIRDVFGDGLQAPAGVLHVAAVWQSPSGDRLSLRIGPNSPRSSTDRFALNLARARCDAIVTTGRILRDEPQLRHALPPDLADWRRDSLGRADAATSVVLTGRADLDLSHPLFSGPGPAPRVIVVTSPDAARSLSQRSSGERIEVIGRDAPSLRDTIGFLQQERGLASVCVEAGPSSSTALYAPTLLVNELMLSVYLGALGSSGAPGSSGALGDLVDDVRGVPFEPAVLERSFALVHACTREEESGRWLFQRFVSQGS